MVSKMTLLTLERPYGSIDPFLNFFCIQASVTNWSGALLTNKKYAIGTLDFVLSDWHIRNLVRLDGRKSSSSPWCIRFKRNICGAFFCLLLSAEQILSSRLMRKSRLVQFEIDISPHIMCLSNTVIFTRMKKAARGCRRDAAFVYARNIPSAVSTPPSVAL